MNINTYLNFNGDCCAAFEFYRSVFGGELAKLMTFADDSSDVPVPDKEKNLIMNVSLAVGSGVLMGCDNTSASGPPATIGDNFSVNDALGRYVLGGVGGILR